MMKNSVLLMFFAAALVSGADVRAGDTNVVAIPALAVPAGVSVSEANEARAAINRAMDWLLKKQKPDGSWSNPDYPALTALPLWALEQGGSKNKEAIRKAVKFILADVHADGSIYATPKDVTEGGGLPNYNTALCMIALDASGLPEAVPAVLKARSWMAKSQHIGNDVYNGGMGYGSGHDANGRPSADLSNSHLAYEAMRLTQNVEELRKAGDPHADLDWNAATQFLSRVQNLPGVNDQPSAAGDPADKGGFIYRPGKSNAGSFTNASGQVFFRSYGSMTYAGLLSLIYANVSKDDPRVKSAFDWATKHWSLKENPGMGQQGLYYFINVLTKALGAYGQDVITLPDGQRINWRDAVIIQLVNTQQQDDNGGFWKNDADRWFEGDPVLVTAYGTIALEIAAGTK